VSGDSSSYTMANFGALNTGAENFAIAANTLRRELDELETSLQAKLAAWEGDTQTAYWECKKKWDAAAADMQRIIAQLGLAIGTAHQNYQAAENFGKSVWT
jgi:early secretory antigenic target protein ESAT-6